MSRKMCDFRFVNLRKCLLGQGLKKFKKIGICWPRGARLVEKHRLNSELRNPNEESMTNDEKLKKNLTLISLINADFL